MHMYSLLKRKSKRVFLIQNTYNRHHRKQQELSASAHLENFESRTGDIQQREDFIVDIDEGNQGENLAEDVMDESQGGNLNLVGLDEDNSILLEDSDAQSFSFNEEDNEYYSDYGSEEDDSEEDDSEEDNDEEENKDNEDMQPDDDDSKKIIEGLRLLHLKSLYNFTETAYDNIMKI